MEFHPFDVSAKEIVWDGPAQWVEHFVGGPPRPVTVITFRRGGNPWLQPWGGATTLC
jgi:hypothetical protein